MAELSEQKDKDTAGSKKTSRSRSGFWFGFIIFAVVLSVSGAGYYLLMQLRDRQADLGGEVKGEMSKKISDYQAQLTAIQTQLATLESAMSSKDTHYTKTLDDYAKLHNEKLDNSRKELSEAITHLQRQLGKTRGDWLIADAEYLLSVANERLHLIGDINTTRVALEAADQRLRESGDAAVFSVREQIAKEIGALKQIPVVDTVGLYASVQTLQEQIEQLTLLLPYSGKDLTPPKEPQSGNEQTTENQDIIDSALNELEDMVTIRHTEQPIIEILTPQQAQFTREQLRIKLEMVKLALVQQNEAVYASSLQDGEKWLKANFTQNGEANKFIDELNRLKGIKIRSHFPDISASLNMLRNITKLRIDNEKAESPDASIQDPNAQKSTDKIPVTAEPPSETEPAKP